MQNLLLNGNEEFLRQALRKMLNLLCHVNHKQQGMDVWANYRSLSGFEFFAPAASNYTDDAVFTVNWRNDIEKNDITKLLVQGAAKRVLQLSTDVELLRSEMIKLAKQLPEYETVDALYGVGETLAAQLIGEIGDVRRFESKRSIVAFAGVDPDKNDSGKKVSISGSVSRRGDALLRKTVYQVVESYLLNSPADEPVYQFLDKKRSEGKHFYSYMTTACNKFLRIYYARVMEFMDTLEAKSQTEQEISVQNSESINTPLAANNISAFTCNQDRATLGRLCQNSGSRSRLQLERRILA